MRIYCLQFLESPRTSDQSDLKGSKKHSTARSRSGKVDAFGQSRWDTLDLQCFSQLRKGWYRQAYWIHSVWIVPWRRPHSRSHHRFTFITATRSKAEINLRDFSITWGYIRRQFSAAINGRWILEGRAPITGNQAGRHCSDHKPNKRRRLFIPIWSTISKSTPKWRSTELWGLLGPWIPTIHCFLYYLSLIEIIPMRRIKRGTA